MSSKSKAKTVPLAAPPKFAPELAEGVDITLHGQLVNVLTITGDEVKFVYSATQQQHSMARGVQWLTAYLKSGVLPVGTILTRNISGHEVRVSVTSITRNGLNCFYDLDIDSGSEELNIDLTSVVTGKALMRWHAHREVAVTEADAPEGEAIDKEMFDAAVTTAVKATVGEAESRNALDAANLKIAALTAEVQRLEAKSRIVSGQLFDYVWDNDVKPDKIIQRRNEGFTPCHFQFSADLTKLGAVYQKPASPEPIPAPQPEKSAGIPTHDGVRPPVLHRAVRVRPQRPSRREESDERVRVFMDDLKVRSTDRLEEARRRFASIRSPFSEGVTP